MATASDLKVLSTERIMEAEVLLNNHHFTGSYYLGGYALEFALKAVICKRLGVEMFDDGISDIPRDISRMFRIHNIANLIILSGLQQEQKRLIKTDLQFSLAWSTASVWNEQKRYQTGCSQLEAKGFLYAVKILITWIQQHW
jgi:hypothetical protein